MAREARAYEGLTFGLGPRRCGFCSDLFLYARSRRTSVEWGTERICLIPSSNRRKASGPSMHSGNGVAGSIFILPLFPYHSHVNIIG